MKSEENCSSSEDTRLGLQLEIEHRGPVVIVRCKGRIVYRNEAAELSDKIGKLLESGQAPVLDFAAVEAIDSAGLGELVLLHMRGQSTGRRIKLASPNQRVRHLLEITNLVSILDLYPTLDAAIDASSRQLARRYKIAASL